MSAINAGVITKAKSFLEQFRLNPDAAYTPRLSHQFRDRVRLVVDDQPHRSRSSGQDSIDARVARLSRLILTDVALGSEVLFLLLANSKGTLSRVDEATLLPELRADIAFQERPQSLVTNACAVLSRSTTLPAAETVDVPREFIDAIGLVSGAVHDDVWSSADKAFHSLDDLPLSTQHVWMQHDGIPRLYPAAQFAPKKEAFTDMGLFMKFLTAPATCVGVHAGGLVRQGPRQNDFVSHMIRQMSYHHNGTEPHGVTHNLALVLDKSEGFIIPHLTDQPVPEEEGSCEVFWVLRGGRTNAHIDHGMKVISMPIGRRISAFYMWPPTQENLSTFDKASESGQSFHALSAQLTHGIKQLVTSEHALLLPSGTIHAVQTFTDGFIVTTGYLDRASAAPLSALMGNSPNYLMRLSPDDRAALLRRYLSSAMLAPVVAAEYWETALPGLRTLLRDLSKHGLQKMWRVVEDCRSPDCVAVITRMSALMQELRADDIVCSATIDIKARKKRR